MQLKNIKLENLVGPDQFSLISQEDILEDLVEKINEQLEAAVDEEEIYDSSDAKVEIFISPDETENQVDEAYNDDIVEAVRIAYTTRGWKHVAYEFRQEDEYRCANHKFTFYFPDKDTTYKI